MGRRIVIIQGHPDRDPSRLCRQLADAYAQAAVAAGHAVDRVDVAALDFPLLASQAEFETAPLPAALQPAWDAIAAAEHVVIVFPLWLGTMPALLKAFLEQVMRPGLAFRYPEGGGTGFPKKMLTGRSARVVVTMGMPALFYRLWYRAHGIAGLRRNILNFVGLSPVRETLFGMVGQRNPHGHAARLQRMRELGRQAR